MNLTARQEAALVDALQPPAMWLPHPDPEHSTRKGVAFRVGAVHDLWRHAAWDCARWGAVILNITHTYWDTALESSGEEGLHLPALIHVSAGMEPFAPIVMKGRTGYAAVLFVDGWYSPATMPEPGDESRLLAAWDDALQRSKDETQRIRGEQATSTAGGVT